jgi:PAN domain
MSAAGHADLVGDAEKEFRNQRYGFVFQQLLAYRFDNEGTLRSDFMLAVSACKLADPDFKAFGGALLAVLPGWYGVRAPENIQAIENQRRNCPSDGLTEQEAVARLRGKSDTGTHTSLAPNRSQSGRDDPLPFAPATGLGGIAPPVGRSAGVVPPPPPPQKRMGPLLVNRGFQGGTDYRQARTPSAAECSRLCDLDGAVCVAMTYLVNEQTCYLKNGLTQLVQTGNMVSAVKQ